MRKCAVCLSAPSCHEARLLLARGVGVGLYYSTMQEEWMKKGVAEQSI